MHLSETYVVDLFVFWITKLLDQLFSICNEIIMFVVLLDMLY